MAENPEKAFSGNGKRYKYEARIAELERMLGQLHAENELLKKSLRHDAKEGPRGENQTDTRRRFMIIQETLSDGLQLSITQSCQALEVSRSDYFKWRMQSGTIPSANSENKDLRDQIQEAALEFPGYGYRRITVELRNRGYAVNHKRVLRLMRADNLLCLKKKFRPMTTDSNIPAMDCQYIQTI